MPHARSAVLLVSLLPATLIGCSSKPGAGACRTITVSAAPAIAPAVEQTARRYNGASACGRVNVVRQDPGEVAAVLSGQAGAAGTGATSKPPDAWIPDSSLWLPIARRTAVGAAAVRPSGPSVAISPLVLATRADQRIGTPSWRMLLSAGLPGTAAKASLRVRFLDPAAQSAGLGALLLANRASGKGRTGLGAFAVTLYGNLGTPVPDERAAFTALAQGKDAFVLPEQSVWLHNRTGSGQLIAAHYPAEGSISLDFPYLTTTAGRSETTMAFGSALADPQGQTTMQENGLRTPDGAAYDGFGRYKVAAKAPKRLVPQDPETVAEILQMWQRTVLGARMLVLLDVSPSMGDQVPGTSDTRMQATAKIGNEGMRLFSDNSQVAFWQFSTQLDGARDYRQVVPFRTLTDKVGTETQRSLLLRAFATARPAPGTRTALYDSILAAYKQTLRAYQPDRNNLLVVLTDGKNYDPGATITLNRLLAQLKKLADPMRPVAIVPIAFGPDIEPAPLRAIAKTTGGNAFVTLDPRQIQQVFLDMLIRLTCGQSCPMP